MASAIAFSVCLFSIVFLILYVTNFLILLHIRPLSPNCDMCVLEFAARGNLRRHDTLWDPNCNVCAPEFAAGVNLRRHDTSPGPNCDVCAPEFAARVNLRRHDTLTRTEIKLMTIFC